MKPQNDGKDLDVLDMQLVGDVATERNKGTYSVLARLEAIEARLKKKLSSIDDATELASDDDDNHFNTERVAENEDVVCFAVDGLAWGLEVVNEYRRSADSYFVETRAAQEYHRRYAAAHLNVDVADAYDDVNKLEDTVRGYFCLPKNA